MMDKIDIAHKEVITSDSSAFWDGHFRLWFKRKLRLWRMALRVKFGCVVPN